MKRRILLSVALFLVFLPATIRAELILSVTNLTLPVGGIGYVDVMVSSNSNDGDLVNAFNLDLCLATQGQTRLEFATVQPDLQLSDNDYIFFNNSFASDTTIAIGAVSTLVEPNDRFVGGDNTANFADVLVTSPRLLARLQVTADTALPPNEGDVFVLAVNANSTSFQNGDVVNPTLVGFSVSNTGTISVVPEPAVLILLGIGVAAYFVFSFGIRYAALLSIGR
jgi:hypothetical protein